MGGKSRKKDRNMKKNYRTEGWVGATVMSDHVRLAGQSRHRTEERKRFDQR